MSRMNKYYKLLVMLLSLLLYITKMSTVEMMQTIKISIHYVRNVLFFIVSSALIYHLFGGKGTCYVLLLIACGK